MRGHFQKMCRNNKIHEIQDDEDSSDAELEYKQRQNRNVSEIWDSELNCVDNHPQRMTVWTITNKEVIAFEWFKAIWLSQCKINLKIDSGSDVNILNDDDFQKTNTISRLTLSAHTRDIK